MLELLLDFARRATLGSSHEVTDRDVRRDFNEQMDVIARQHTVDDLHAQLVTHLPDDLAHSEPDRAVQHLVTVFGCPDDMIAMMKCRVTPLAVCPNRVEG